jgi:hypothetical protein
MASPEGLIQTSLADGAEGRRLPIVVKTLTVLFHLFFLVSPPPVALSQFNQRRLAVKLDASTATRAFVGFEEFASSLRSVARRPNSQGRTASCCPKVLSLSPVLVHTLAISFLVRNTHHGIGLQPPSSLNLRSALFSPIARSSSSSAVASPCHPLVGWSFPPWSSICILPGVDSATSQCQSRPIFLFLVSCSTCTSFSVHAISLRCLYNRSAGSSATPSLLPVQ